MKVFNAKVGGVALQDIAIAGLTKYFEERALAGVIGNGTLMSGGIKLAIGYFLGQQKNSMVKAAGLGFGVDGMEDVLQSLLGSSSPITQMGQSNSAMVVV